MPTQIILFFTKRATDNPDGSTENTGNGTERKYGQV